MHHHIISMLVGGSRLGHYTSGLSEDKGEGCGDVVGCKSLALEMGPIDILISIAQSNFVDFFFFFQSSPSHLSKISPPSPLVCFSCIACASFKPPIMFLAVFLPQMQFKYFWKNNCYVYGNATNPKVYLKSGCIYLAKTEGQHVIYNEII